MMLILLYTLCHIVLNNRFLVSHRLHGNLYENHNVSNEWKSGGQGTDNSQRMKLKDLTNTKNVLIY